MGNWLKDDLFTNGTKYILVVLLLCGLSFSYSVSCYA